MARGNTYTCRVCGKIYSYCPSCGLVPVPYLEDGFCCLDHANIFEILSKNGCNLATAEETLNALKGYDLTGLNEGIQAHIDSLKPVRVEVRPAVAETKAEAKPAKVEVKPEAKAEEVKEPEVAKKHNFRGQE